jgi:hypothetical protein
VHDRQRRRLDGTVSELYFSFLSSRPRIKFFTSRLYLCDSLIDEIYLNLGILEFKVTKNKEIDLVVGDSRYEQRINSLWALYYG